MNETLFRIGSAVALGVCIYIGAALTRATAQKITLSMINRDLKRQGIDC